MKIDVNLTWISILFYAGVIVEEYSLSKWKDFAINPTLHGDGAIMAQLWPKPKKCFKMSTVFELSKLIQNDQKQPV